MFKFLEAQILWCSKKQNVVALSSCEVEYIATCNAACQTIWLQKLPKEIGVRDGGAVELLVDNKLAIYLAKNPIAHAGSKHIDTV